MGNAQTKSRKVRAGGNKYVHWGNAERPHPPGRPRLVSGGQIQPDEVTIRWDPPVIDGGAPITGYLVEHRRTGSPYWIRSAPCMVASHELTLSGLEPGWRYQFRVSAENAAGLSEPGEVSDALTVTLSRSVAALPCFTKELQDTVALENEKTEFNVQFCGSPAPKVCWYKDGFEIFTSRRMKIVTENEQSTLVIYQAAFSDEGEIKCTATNRVGHVVTKAKLRLEAPPKVRLPRQYEDGLLFERDEVLRLKVAVAGRPLPRVSWFHNGEPVAFGGRYEVVNTERSSALRVAEARREDRGEYQVRASSRLGDHTASFLVTVTDRPMPPGKANVTISAGRSVTLSWTMPEDDGGCKIGNYIVEYFRVGWNVWLKAATCRQLSTTLQDLIEGSEYKFRVKAENPYGVSDPSEESGIIFIPDPKRGMLEAPSRSSASQGDVSSPKERPAKIPAPRSASLPRVKEPLAPVKPSTITRTIMDSIKKKEVNVKIPSEEDIIADHKPDLRPVPVIMLEESLRQRSSPPPLPPKKPARKSPELLREIAPKAQLSLPEDRRPSISPREQDDSILHGSSELMLVLLPNGRDAHEQRDIDRQFDAELDIPPPMSLSAPELGSGEPEIIHPLRNAVSSSELLHEKAMARFYQAVAAEEQEKALQRRKSIDRRSRSPAREMRRHSDTPMRPRRSPHDEEQQELARIREKLNSTRPVRRPAHQHLEIEDASFGESEEEEEEPYHPRGIITSGEVKQSPIFQRRTTPPRSLERDPMMVDEEDTYHPKIMIPRTIKAMSPLRHEPPPLDSPVQPKPILKNRSTLSPPLSPEPRMEETPFNFEPLPTKDTGDTVVLRKKKEEKQKPSSGLEEAKLREDDVGLSAAEIARKRRMQSRQQSLEEDAVLQKVVTSHYGDIIREYGQTKKPQKVLYLNTEELKAAAYSSGENLDEPEIDEAWPEDTKNALTNHIPTERLWRPLQNLADDFEEKYYQSTIEHQTKSPVVIEEQLYRHETEAKPLQVKTEIIEKQYPVYEKTDSYYDDVEGNEVAEERAWEQRRQEIMEEERKLMMLRRQQQEEERQWLLRKRRLQEDERRLQEMQRELEERCSSAGSRPITPELQETIQTAEKNVRSWTEYLLDLTLFLVACWVYIFHNELYAIPIMLLMLYRQLKEAIIKRIPKRFRRKET